MTTIRALFDARAAAGVQRTYGIEVDGEAFTVRLEDGAIDVFQGEQEGADLVLRGDSDTVLALASGELPPERAIADGSIAVDHGDPDEALAFVRMIRLPAAATASAEDDAIRRA